MGASGDGTNYHFVAINPKPLSKNKLGPPHNQREALCTLTEIYMNSQHRVKLKF